MTEKQSLIISIYKYTWFKNNPDSKLLFNSEKDECVLCDYSKTLDKELGLDSYKTCINCPMFGLWPAPQGTTEECDDTPSAWDSWDDYDQSTNNLSCLDSIFFSTLLVEAFHSKLQSLYK